ncbi:hypothetical protein ACIQOV_19300 [Kitasatospora sp. NPDC091257]|uniref:hypothetical protein n=1 Tax=Kitasatospora sp. NPDC091257 TaxID=3364084 RepID=UPI00382BAD16
MGRSAPVAGLHVGARLVVPVLGAAAGSGRSTVALLAAAGLARLASTVVLDSASTASSPWRRWPLAGGAGLASVPVDRPLSTGQVRSAASSCLDGRVQVLTDRRPWSEPPLALPSAPSAWPALAGAGGWQVSVVDTALTVADDLGDAGVHSRTAQWMLLEGAVPVICSPTSREGLEAAAVAIAAAEAASLPLQRCVLVLVGMAGGMPRQCRAVATMLAPQVGAVVRVPHCPAWRAHALRTDRLSRRFEAAGTGLADTLITTAERSWGPLRAPAGTAATSEDPSHDDLYVAAGSPADHLAAQ